MASVPITIHGRRFEIACEAGQEAQIGRLARYVDDRVRQLSAAVGNLGDTKLLLMTSLLLADELSEANDQLDALKDQRTAAERGRSEEVIIERLDKITRTITSLSETLEETQALPDEDLSEDTAPSREEQDDEENTIEG